MKPMALIGSLALAAASSLAYAQGTSTPASPTQSAPAPNSSNQSSTAAQPSAGSGGIRMGEAAPPVVVRFVTMRPADTMSSVLIGTDVYNNNNEKIGDIEDLVIQDGKTITGVVVSTGGFLGMGERYVLLEPSSVVLSQKDGNTRAFINTTKDDLKNAPAFSYSKKKS